MCKIQELINDKNEMQQLYGTFMQLSDDNLSQVVRCFVLLNVLGHQGDFRYNSPNIISKKLYSIEICILLNGKLIIK